LSICIIFYLFDICSNQFQKEPREKEREIGKGAFGKCFQVEFPLENGGTVNVAIKEVGVIYYNDMIMLI
jgi:hypothetical protein